MKPINHQFEPDTKLLTIQGVHDIKSRNKSMKLRNYQEQCLSLINNLLETNPRGLNRYCVLPTGSGKTEIFKRIASSRVLVLVNKADLRNQLANRYETIHDSILTIGSGKHLSKDLLETTSADIVVATIQTLEKDIGKFPLDYFNVIVIDEFHHTETDLRYKKVIENLSYSLCLGFSATPPKTSSIFDTTDLLYEYSIFDAWQEHYLMKPDIFHLQLRWDKSKLYKTLHSSKIQWNDNDITQAFISYTQENFELILNQLIKLNNAEKCVVYFPSIELSNDFSDFCNKKGYVAYSLTSKTKKYDREQYIKQFENRRDVILSNVFVLAEGLDVPSIECILNTRPTENKNLYKQIVGRALRPCDNKYSCKICDCIVEQNDYLFQQTFITAYCMPNDLSMISIDREFYENLCTDINNSKSIENISSDLCTHFDLCYQLIQVDKLYCNTYDIPYYIDKKKNIIYGHGIAYEKKRNFDGNLVDDYDKVKFNLYFYIDSENQLHLSFKKYPEPLKFESKEDCFKWLSENYCKYGNIFKDNSYTRKKGNNKLTEPQLSCICNYIVNSHSVSSSIAKHICRTLSRKQASSIISRILTEEYILRWMYK